MKSEESSLYSKYVQICVICVFVAITYFPNFKRQLAFFFFSGIATSMNTKQPLDEHLMHSELIRCFMAANVLPSHPQGLESAPTVGVIVLIITRAKPEKRLLSRFGKTKQNEKKKNQFLCSSSFFTTQARSLAVVLRDPLFSLA